MLAAATAALVPDAADGRAELTRAMQRVRTHRRVAASTADAAQWWPRFAAAGMTTARKRTAQRVKAAAAVARVTVARSAPTPAQRAEREQTKEGLE